MSLSATIIGAIPAPRSRERSQRRRLVMLKMSPSRDDVATPVTVATAVAEVADELLHETPCAAGAARRALERMRSGLQSAEAQLWVIDRARASRVLRTSADAEATPDSPAEVQLNETALSRLHRNGAVFCRRGEVSDLEPLVSAGVRAYIVAASGRDAATGVLVLGWTEPVPRWADDELVHLRIASALLARAVRGSEWRSTCDARLADSLPIPVWIAGRDGRVIHGNERWAEATATSVRNADATIVWWDAFHPDDRRRARFAFRSAVSRRGYLDLELRMRAPDGNYRWSSCVGAPQCTPDGNVERFVGFCSDATAKRRVESAFGEVAGKLVRAEEAARSRIARELHDDLGQQVSLLATKLETLALAYRPGSRIRVGLADAQTSLHELSTSLHTLSHRLHPAKLKLLGLTQTLDHLCRDVSAESRVQVTFEARDVPSDLQEDNAVCIFRVTQEALQNAVKHSGARHVSVQLTGSASRLMLRVTDSGRGFDPPASHSDGIGLLTMRERVELVGGRLRIEAAPERGTTIKVILPARGVPGRRSFVR